MAKTGPLPATNDARVAQHADRQNTVITVTRKVRIPAAIKGWHELARGWYLALKFDGQAQLYQQSDWHVARHIAQLMSDYHNASIEDRTASERLHILTLLDKIYATPEARQRARIEVRFLLEENRSPPGDEPKSPSRIEELRRRKTGAD
ncbi:MAG: hypothetical protein F4Z28_13365 [Gammaproteobacteria bacterium]|nr:hypothetical protein [Gammaproteobacteria bacterium]